MFTGAEVQETERGMDTNVWRTHDLTAGHQQLAVHKGVAQVKDLALAVRRLVDLDDDDGNGRHEHLQSHATQAPSPAESVTVRRVS